MRTKTFVRITLIVAVIFVLEVTFVCATFTRVSADQSHTRAAFCTLCCASTDSHVNLVP